MARVEIPITVDKLSSGNWVPASGASVQINHRGGSAATLYSAASAGTTVPNPLTTDSEGRVTAYADEGSYDAVISGAGITTNTVEFELSRADSLITIGTSKITDGAITTAKLADNSVTTAKIVNGAVTASKLATDAQLPAGIILPYGGAAAPTGYLLCDGTSYATATYAALFGAIGYSYGGSGANFNVPDLRGRAPYGKGTHADVDALGESDGLAQSSRTPKHTHTLAHTHSIANYTHFHEFWFEISYAQRIGYAYSPGQYNARGLYFPYEDDETQPLNPITKYDTHNHGGVTGAASSATTSVGVSPYLVTQFIIKT